MRPTTKRVLWAIALAVLAAVLVVANLPDRHAPAGAAVGEELPDFAADCLDGTVFRLHEQRGKVVVINVWATWCAPCVKELPNFDRLQQEFPAQTAVLALHALPVTADVPDYLSAFSYRIPFTVDDDGRLSALLGVSATLPQTLIVSPEGIVTYNRSGALTYEELTDLVSQAAR